MRQILNISLPLEMVREIKSEMKRQKFSSVSEFVRAAIRAYYHEIGWRRLQKSEKDFAEGKYTRANSVRDLE
ncbi:MAG TPA: ribbon-helix-helix domain-containing protein [Candidatus Paceibacterota bacterium]